MRCSKAYSYFKSVFYAECYGAKFTTYVFRKYSKRRYKLWLAARTKALRGGIVC